MRIPRCGRVEQRRRSLPARAVAYFAMGMALHADGSYEDVLAHMTDGLAWAQRAETPVRLATKAAISHARDRLGPEPLALLFERVAQPLATNATPRCASSAATKAQCSSPIEPARFEDLRDRGRLGLNQGATDRKSVV